MLTEPDCGLLAEILDLIPERVVRFTLADHAILYCNPAWAAGHGSTPAELRGRRVDDLLSPDEMEGFLSQLERLGPDQPILADVVPRPAPEAPERWLAWIDQLVADGREVLTVGRDVTERHVAEQALAESEALFRALVDRSADAVFHLAFAPHPHFTYLNPAAELTIGPSPLDLGADSRFLLAIVDDEGRALVTAALAGEPIPDRFDAHFRRPDGLIVIGEMQITSVPGGLQGVGRDVTKIRALQAELTELAMRDPLTGLANRRLLEELLLAAIDHSKRAGTDLSVAFLDLDGLKHVNDTHGHEAGDLVLQEVARRTLATVRAADAVARVGGDEFVIVYDSREPSCENLVARVSEALARPIDIGGGVSVHCPASIGEASTSTVGWDRAALLAAADSAMYEVKRTQRHMKGAR